MNTITTERDPHKRKIKPPTESLLDVIDFEESTDDSDFNIEDHEEHSESEDDSSGHSNASDDESETGSSDQESPPEPALELQINEIPALQGSKIDISKILICCVCLGDRSDHVNEIVECDYCGVSVHESCYGISENQSIASSDSLTPTEPWFCEPCRAGVKDPDCELCPNHGGIFKATDVGRWVHLVCALYISGVAFGDVEGLRNVTLFEMQYTKWGAKSCILCLDHRLARTGVHISCDAGMCKQYFHVTCAQREGLLSETFLEEVDQADPFYAHCKLHTDKQAKRRRKNNYLVMQCRLKQRGTELEETRKANTPAQIRIERKLKRKREKYAGLKMTSAVPWLPTQKMPRLLTTSAAACRTLWQKTEKMGIDVLDYENREARLAIINDIGKRWHIPPAFGVEFTGYFLDRNNRIPIMKQTLQTLVETNNKLTQEHETLDKKYESVVEAKKECESTNKNLTEIIEEYHKVLKLVEPNKRLPLIQDLILNSRSHGSPMMVPTAAALKAGVGYPILRTNYKGQQQTEPKLPMSQNHECGVCHTTKDQHLLTKCDTCSVYYHLNCLNPPLTRMPKKTKLMGWQCSECDKDSGSEKNQVLGPRRPRHKSPPMFPDEYFPRVKLEDISKKEFKLKRKKHRKSSADRKKKKKRESDESLNTSEEKPVLEKSYPRIKITIKAISIGDGKDKRMKMFMSSGINEDEPVNSSLDKSENMDDSKVESSGKKLPCVKCGNLGDKSSCDECSNNYHFGCLDPPLKKSPKVRGYSWHCADCDPTDKEIK